MKSLLENIQFLLDCYPRFHALGLRVWREIWVAVSTDKGNFSITTRLAATPGSGGCMQWPDWSYGEKIRKKVCASERRIWLLHQQLLNGSWCLDPFALCRKCFILIYLESEVGLKWEAVSLLSSDEVKIQYLKFIFINTYFSGQANICREK